MERANEEDSSETSSSSAAKKSTTDHDVELTIFPIEDSNKKGKTKLGRGAFGTVRV